MVVSSAEPKVCRHRSVSSSSGASLRPPLALPLQRNVGEHLKRIPGVTLFDSSRAQLWNTLHSVHDDADPSLKPLFSVYTPESPDLSLTEYDVFTVEAPEHCQNSWWKAMYFQQVPHRLSRADGYAFLMSARYNIGCVSFVLCARPPIFQRSFPMCQPVPSLICSLQDFVPIRSTALQQPRNQNHVASTPLASETPLLVHHDAQIFKMFGAP